MDILKQLNDAAVYIETNLCGEVALEELAQIACVTKDSFLRFFSYMTGMTLNGYIRRRRLSLAAYELRESDILTGFILDPSRGTAIIDSKGLKNEGSLRHVAEYLLSGSGEGMNRYGL